jgi:hypothetical protein
MMYKLEEKLEEAMHLLEREQETLVDDPVCELKEIQYGHEILAALLLENSLISHAERDTGERI